MYVYIYIYIYMHIHIYNTTLNTPARGPDPRRESMQASGGIAIIIYLAETDTYSKILDISLP